MKGLEDLGLLKLDFLGLRNLTVIDNAIKLIEQNGKKIDIENISLDDQDVYKLFTKLMHVQFEVQCSQQFYQKEYILLEVDEKRLQL